MFRNRYAMFKTRFEVGIEKTGITRKDEADTFADFFGACARIKAEADTTYIPSRTMMEGNGRS